MRGYIGRASSGHARGGAVLLAIALVVMVAGTSFAADGEKTWTFTIEAIFRP